MNPSRDPQPSWHSSTFGPQHGINTTNSYELHNLDNSDTFPSSPNASTSMLHRPLGDSGFYDVEFSELLSSSSVPQTNASLISPHDQQPFDKGPSVLQESVSDQLAKWEKWLYDWYVNNDRKIPSDDQLHFFSALISAPEHALRAKFQQYYDWDKYRPGSLVYSGDGNQDTVAPPNSTELSFPALAIPPTAVPNMTTRLVELTANEDVSVVQLPLGVEAETRSGTNPSMVLNMAEILPQSRRVSLTPSLLSLIWELVKVREVTGCGKIRSHEYSNPSKSFNREQRTWKYQCTVGCGRRFKSPSDLNRHENTRYLQNLWFCTRCGDLDNASKENLYLRDDKFRAHIRRAHPDWANQGGLADCKVPSASVPFPRRCGFCDRNQFYARTWTHRCDHITNHFKSGADMTQWRVWPEEDPDDDDDDDDLEGAEIDVPKPDDDDDDDDDGTGDSEDKDEPSGSPPPDADTSQAPDDSSGDAPEKWSPSIGEFLLPWDSNSLSHGFACNVVVSPLSSQQGLNESQKSSQWVLPILSKERINLKGGTGSVHRIEVPRSHCNWTGKDFDDPNPGTAHLFAVKTYHKHQRQIYDREIEAFTRLSQLGNSHQAILKCFGSFIQPGIDGPTYNILLEYAHCDLEEYFADTPPPTSSEERALLWKQLCDVANALQALHNGFSVNGDNGRVVCWHADLKPANILRVENQWKIADFGFSKFVETDNSKVCEQMMDGGSLMWSAPECGGSSDGKIRVPVSQKIDVWSLGCIISEIATWVILGFSGIRKLEEHLKIAIQDTGIDNHRAMPVFHDGKKVLPEVAKWHKGLRRNMRPDDGITAKILDLVDEHLLQGDPKSRFDSKELCNHLDQLLQEEDQNRKHSPPSLVELIPFEVPMDAKTTPGGDGTLEDWFEVTMDTNPAPGGDGALEDWFEVTMDTNPAPGGDGTLEDWFHILFHRERQPLPLDRSSWKLWKEGYSVRDIFFF
ncbi:hypothetical protein K505DRAFT_365536 [Melanomma pulvis-pyrius CBS 109.77]|uniref:Kinase-like protein n=1 Tax=Melanomma pulvis-pyrius CBS 109.77 TaxID=1314802 RepID=A0A6A6X002_9PLEO|nr:hypothetical protein K505DRAFT_365536 [Melanomma pulvis-pyrius CBS 109.77]